MSLGLESTDFEWLDPQVSGSMSSISSENRPGQFLKEGYLHIMEKKVESSQLGRAMSLVRKLSNPAILVYNI